MIRFIHTASDVPGACFKEYERPPGIETMAKELAGRGYHFFARDAHGMLTMECARLEGEGPAGEPLVSAMASRMMGVSMLEIDMLIMSSYVRATWLEMRDDILRRSAGVP
jgi:hypothetical protein